MLEHSSLRSLSSAAVAVGVTGALSISIPLAIVAGIFGHAASPASAQPVAVTSEPAQPTAEVRLTGCDGRELPAHPVLHPGDCVLLRAAGFHAAERVQVRESGRPRWSRTVRAEATGGLDYRLVVGAHVAAGQDEVSFHGVATAHVSCAFTVAPAQTVAASRR